jgi:hypothetical protein
MLDRSPANPAEAVRMMPSLPRPRALLRLLVLAAVGGALAAATAGPASAATLLSDDFSQPNGLITNAYAFWNPSKPGIATSPIWAVHSGSMFAKDGMGWSGVPDDAKPDACSCNGTGSAVMRAATRRTDFGDVDVSFDLVNQGLSTTGSTPAVAWDGLHVWLRYQSEYSLYYASVNRRDNTVIIKKKVPGGPASSNYGTYYDLGPGVPYTVPYGQVQHVTATVRTNADGSVTIALFVGAAKLVEATDRGAGGTPPLTTPGAVGLRGDNANLLFDNFQVTDGAPAAPPPAAAPRPQPATPSAPAQPVTAAPGAHSARPAAPAGARARSARRLGGDRVRVRIACPAARCDGTLVLTTASGRRLSRGRFSLPRGNRGLVILRLPAAALRHRRIAARALVITRTPTGTVRTSRSLRV